MNPLSTLQTALHGFAEVPLQAVFEPPAELRSYVQKLAKRFGAANSAKIRPERMAQVLRQLLASGRFDTARDLRYACYGIAQEVGPNRQRVIATPKACNALFDSLDSVTGNRSRLRGCYLGLLATYLSFDGRNVPEPARSQWVKVQEFLRRMLPNVTSESPVPEWARVLEEHKNLLGDDPCKRYAKELLSGEQAEFDAVTNALGILDQSWVVQEAAAATIRAACALPHDGFKNVLTGLLDLFTQHPLILSEGLGQILRRYAQIPGQPEHSTLLKLSLDTWHNPLFARNLVNWDLAGKEATAMVAQWLKSNLIEDFFEHLSSDGGTDKRRVRFWKSYVGSISNMYFALGRKALSSRDKDVVRLRQLMGDNLLRMEGGSYSNNGFFMVIGNRVIAEFGEKGNAVYFFHQDHLPFKLKGTIRGDGKLEWRNLQGVHVLFHSDNALGYTRWETRFKSELASKLKVAPDDGPALGRGTVQRTAPKTNLNDIRGFCARRGIAYGIEDNGALIVIRIGATNPSLAEQLRAMGFTYNNSNARWERLL